MAREFEISGRCSRKNITPNSIVVMELLPEGWWNNHRVQPSISRRVFWNSC